MSLEGVEKIRRDWAKGDAKRDAGLTTPADVQRFDDLSYGPDPKFNVLDVYCPVETLCPLPTIISIHGGGWCYGDKELYQHYCMRLAERGFTVVNFTYRLAPEAPYPAALMDCVSVLRWIFDNAGDYYIDKKNLFILGDSAGAQLCHQVCTALTNPSYARLCGLKFPEDLTVRACCLNCGMYFFPATRLFSPAKMNMIGDYLTRDYRKFLPQLKVMKNMTSDFPPAFVMGGAADMLTMMIKPLKKRLTKLNVEHEVHVYGSKADKNVGHVFHLNCRLDIAAKCNDDECAFFRKHLS